jgi:hypothetical protein
MLMPLCVKPSLNPLLQPKVQWLSMGQETFQHSFLQAIAEVHGGMVVGMGYHIVTVDGNAAQIQDKSYSTCNLLKRELNLALSSAMNCV